jgi:aryl-alcohol dehydrogenase-like predicted oxidoreductase
MNTMRLGKTNLIVGRSGFGALPIQRLSKDDAVRLLHKARDSGINFFDTARMYSDSEEKIGAAFSGDRQAVVIATKTLATTMAGVLADLAVSLANLETDYVDILQLHNPATLPDLSDQNGSYAGLLEARQKGMARFVGISNHSQEKAVVAARSGLYDTVQFPLSSLSSDKDLAVVTACREADVGLIAMKALSGGLVTNAATTFAFLRQYENVLPIWGIQRESELDEFLRMEEEPPLLDTRMWKLIAKDRQELGGRFCRGCGYCMPCPAGIQINWAARMSLLLRRAPYQGFLTDEWNDTMGRIRDCTQCGNCRSKCPYGLDTPELLRMNLDDYERFRAEHRA